MIIASRIGCSATWTDNKNSFASLSVSLPNICCSKTLSHSGFLSAHFNLSVPAITKRPDSEAPISSQSHSSPARFVVLNTLLHSAASCVSRKITNFFDDFVENNSIHIPR